MKACKNCKYWGPYITVYGTPPENDEGICYKEGDWSLCGKKDNFYVRAEALDDSGLEQYLCTGPDFYCAHFKSKK